MNALCVMCIFVQRFYEDLLSINIQDIDLENVKGGEKST